MKPPDSIAGPFQPTAVDNPDRPFRRLDADLFCSPSQPLLAQALQPIGRALEPVENRHIRHIGEAHRRRHGGYRSQRMAPRAIQESQTQNVHCALHPTRANERPALTR